MKSIMAKTNFEGIHCWPEAPDEVSYLRHPHRHVFYIEATVQVFHDDRELEFIMIKHKIDNYLKRMLDDNGVWQMGRTSCEQVARLIIAVLVQERGQRTITVSVFEDNENGCTVDNK